MIADRTQKADDPARQRIYQTLELESIELFRFECDHAELVQMLWFSDAYVAARDSPLELKTKNYQLKQYICQILNLFEMACRFRKQRIIEPEVFGSWVIWMWELSLESMFKLQWEGEDGIEYNYVGELREIMNAGIHFARARPGEFEPRDRKRSFYGFVADRMFEGNEENQRELVKRWLEQVTAKPEVFDKFWTRSESASGPGST